MILYDFPVSAECYKVRLLLAFLGLSYGSVPVDIYPGEEHLSPSFAAINPLRSVPVLDDDGIILSETNAILTYLATRYDVTRSWFPVLEQPALVGEVCQYLGFGQRLAASAGAARWHESLFYPLDIESARAAAHQLLRLLDEHLWFAEQQRRAWICAAAQPTIADIACFADIMLSEEGGISRLDYPAIRRWCDRVKQIPGFIVMPGIFPNQASR